MQVDKQNAKHFIVLSRFEVCDVVFEKMLIFYHNEYQIVITLSASKGEIIKSMPEFFQQDQINCGGMMIWKDKDSFYWQLTKGQGSNFAQNWYDTFAEIIKTIKLTS